MEFQWSNVYFLVIFLWLPYLSLGDNSTVSEPNGTYTSVVGTHKIPLPIGVLFTHLGYEFYDKLMINTLNFTLNEINRIGGILDDYHLYMRFYFDKQVSTALVSAYDLVYEGQPVPIVWGPLLSAHAVPVSEVLTQYNITQVTLANSENLRDRDKYPYVNQIYPTINYLNIVRIHLMKLMGWKRCVIIFEDVEYWRTHLTDLIELFDKEGISVVTTEPIPNTKELPWQQIESLKRHDVRIIIVAAYTQMTVNITCEAYKQSLNGSKIVWIFPKWITSPILDALDSVTATNQWPCSASDVRQMLELSLAVELRRPLQSLRQLDLHGLKFGENHTRYLEQVAAIGDAVGGDGARHNIDNLLVMLFALNNSIDDLLQLNPPRRLEHYRYEDTDMRDVILRHVRNVSFIGATGKVLMDPSGSRDASGLRFSVYQVQNSFLKEVLYFVEGDEVPRYSEQNSIRWLEYKPVDGETKVFTQHVVSTRLLFIIYGVAITGAVLAIVCLMVNIIYRNNKAIKLSSPTLNNLIVIGSIFLFSYVILLGLDVSYIHNSTLAIICHTQTVLLCVGISLSFGTLFVKTYRIYAIFTYAMSKFKHINLPDSKLLMAVTSIVCLDIVLITIWVLLDPFCVKVYQLEPKLDMKAPEKEIYIINEITYCESRYQLYFTISMYASKGMLLVFGIFLAWSTKDIPVSELNDSRFIALSIYVVAIAVVITAPTLSVFSHDVDVYFAVLGIVITIINTAVLGLIFIPRVISLRHVLRGGSIRLTTMTTGIHSSNDVKSQSQKVSLRQRHSSQIVDPSSTTKDTVFSLTQKLNQMTNTLHALQKELAQCPGGMNNVDFELQHLH